MLYLKLQKTILGTMYLKRNFSFHFEAVFHKAVNLSHCFEDVPFSHYITCYQMNLFTCRTFQSSVLSNPPPSQAFVAPSLSEMLAELNFSIHSNFNWSQMSQMFITLC